MTLMSYESAITEQIDRLRNKGITLERGLTDAEVFSIESQFQFVFPPDLRFFLQTAVPSSKYFVKWRAASKKLRVGSRKSSRAFFTTLKSSPSGIRTGDRVLLACQMRCKLPEKAWLARRD